MSKPRVVSLIASSTEIVCALGFADLLVARSHECDYPQSVSALPQVTEPKIRTDVTSLAIDRQIRNIVRAGLSVYRVDAERLRALDPDVIITQDHCDVCAVSTSDLEAAVGEWLGNATRIVSLRPDTLANVFEDIIRVADALGAPDRGARLVASLQARMAAIQRRAHELTARPRVAFVEWIDPLMAGGNWVPELIDLVHAEAVLGVAGEHSGWIEFETLYAADPEIIIVAPCGFDLERTQAEMTPLLEHPRWPELRAVRNRQVYLADGNAYFNRPGPRVVESLEMLAAMVHPDTFRFAHHESAFRRLP